MLSQIQELQAELARRRPVLNTTATAARDADSKSTKASQSRGTLATTPTAGVTTLTSNLPPFPEATAERSVSLKDLTAHLRARRMQMEANIRDMQQADSVVDVDADLGDNDDNSGDVRLPPIKMLTPSKSATSPSAASRATSSVPSDYSASKELLTELEDANKRVCG